MNQKQINRLEMFQDTNSYLDEQTAIWSAIPIAGNYKNTLVDVINQIKTAAQDQEAAQIFLSKSMRQLKKDIAQKMDLLDDILEAYAADAERPVLLQQAANSESSYYKLKNEDFETKTKNMLDLMTTEIDNLTDYGMTAAQLDDAKLSFNSFTDQRGKPRAYQVASRVATQNLEELFSEGSRTLERLDKVLKRFRRSNSAFFNGYEAARMILDD